MRSNKIYAKIDIFVFIWTTNYQKLVIINLSTRYIDNRTYWCIKSLILAHIDDTIILYVEGTVAIKIDDCIINCTTINN